MEHPHGVKVCCALNSWTVLACQVESHDEDKAQCLHTLLEQTQDIQNDTPELAEICHEVEIGS